MARPKSITKTTAESSAPTPPAAPSVGRIVVFTAFDGRERAAIVSAADARGYGVFVFWTPEDKTGRAVPDRVAHDEDGRPNTIRWPSRGE